MRVSSLVLIALAVYGGGILLLRARIFKRTSHLPRERRDEIVRNMARVTRVTKLMLILSPLYILLIPLILDGYGGPPFGRTAIAFCLLYLNLLENSLYSGWLTRALTALKEKEAAA